MRALFYAGGPHNTAATKFGWPPRTFLHAGIGRAVIHWQYVLMATSATGRCQVLLRPTGVRFTNHMDIVRLR